jgi:hypothetical protein
MYTKYQGAVILISTLAMASFEASAVVPPPPSSGIKGAQTTTDVIVSSNTAWVVLSSSEITIPGDGWHCAATGSADGENPGGGNLNMRYRFTLTLDETAPAVNGPCDRALEFDDNPNIADVNFQEIGSTCTFENVSAGPHTIRWLARKVRANVPNLRVTDNSHSVVCTKDPL